MDESHNITPDLLAKGIIVADLSQEDTIFHVSRIQGLISRIFAPLDGSGRTECIDTLKLYEDVVVSLDLHNTDSFKSCLLEIVNTLCLSLKFDENSMDCDEVGTSIGKVLRVPDLNTVEKSKEADALNYLVRCFNISNVEASNEFLQDFEKEACKHITDVICLSASYLLRGFHSTQFSARLARTYLTRLMYYNLVSDAFLTYLMAQCVTSDSDALAEVFEPIFTQQRLSMLTKKMATQDDSVVQYVYRTIQRLLSLKLPNTNIRPLCDLVVKRADFLPDPKTACPGREIAAMSYLGPFFEYGISADEFTGTVAHQYYPNTEIPKDIQELKMMHAPYQLRLSNFRSLTHKIIHELVVNLSSRSRTLDFLAAVIKRNEKRAQYQASFINMASHMFIANFTSVMFLLSGKIMLDKVNPLYPFQANSRVDIKEMTRIKMDSTEAKNFADAQVVVSEEKFTTECFFLTAQCQNLFLQPTLKKIDHIRQQMGGNKERMTDIRAQLDKLPKGYDRDQLERELKNVESHQKKISQTFLCYDCIVRDEEVLAASLEFSTKQLALLVDSINPDFKFSGNLPEEAPLIFTAYPEFYVEDVLDLVAYATRSVPSIVFETAVGEWPMQLMAFIYRTNYFRKVAILSKLVELLAMLSPGYIANSSNIWNRITNSQIAIDRLFPSLVKFYADIEADGDFYGKFNLRRNIQIIFKNLWNLPHYLSNMIALARQCPPDFIRFINMIINDATFLLDESLAALKKIHDIENFMESSEWNTVSAEEKQQKMTALSEAKRDVRAWLGSSEETLDLLVYLTRDAPQPFKTAVLGDRLASMLNHNVHLLCGKKCTELRVRDALSRFRWNPRSLTSKVVDIYLNLATNEFASFIAHDERSYTPQMFNEVLDRLQVSNIVGQSMIERFRSLATVAEQIYNQKAQEEEDLELDDAPEEYKDSVMFTIMDDPVRLPSGHVMDRKNIIRHLLSSETNPFNRAPLTADQLESMPELQSQIRAWVKEKLGK